MGHRLVHEMEMDLARSYGEHVVVGSAFAFFRREAFRAPALGWVSALLGEGALARPRILPLFGQALALPGASIAPVPVPRLALASVTSDKALYREGRDEVHLFVVDPLETGEAEVVIEIKANGADFGAHPARLDGRGAAAVTLRDLPAGEYEARVRGAPKDAPACGFSVAAYRLAPLVASLSDRRLEGERLSVTIRVESFGAPVDGAVQLTLTDRGRRLADVRAEARGGVCEAAFTLSGEGPHAIAVQLVADPARTASVPLVGSRAAERSKTTFSTLGVEVTGSLLPGAESRPVRGVHLEEGAVRSAPLRLERVDAKRARLTAVTALEAVRLVVIDPTVTRARPGAVDPATAPHPANEDERYRGGESLFQQRRYADARAEFEAALAAQRAPHPNYAYYVACCFAREGNVEAAVGALRRAIRDGWIDWKLLADDDDLAALRGHPAYEAMRRQGRVEIALEDVAAGAPIEVDVPGPIALLAAGAFVGGNPWEGWAALIAPESIAPRITAPERCAPGGDVSIEIDTGRAGDDASVYVVIKDARLLTPDTPSSRLAGGLKAFAEAASKELDVGKPTTTLAAALPHTTVTRYTSAGGVVPPGPPRPPPMPGRSSVPFPAAMPPPGMAAPPPPMMVAAMPLSDSFSAPPAYGAMPPPQGAMPPPRPAVAYAKSAEVDMVRSRVAAPPAAARSAPGAPLQPAPAQAAPAQAAPAAPGPYRQAPAVPPPPSVEEPEVVFAGLVATHGGRAAVTVRLGPDFAEYLVEAFVVAGGDWAPVEARLRAEKEVFASLEVPAFVHPDDAAIARVHVGSRAGARVSVKRDGAEVPLAVGGNPMQPGATLPAGRAELSFLAGPGLYEAVVEDASGVVERAERRVDVPGKLRRVTRSVRFLEPGQQISRDEDRSILALRVLPGLEKPFRALVDATSDYGHACCEQTAAKLLAACAMYVLADADRARRERAEAIILAGVRRERSMWLRGQGFKMYPEVPDRPDTYWGPIAARHLWNLSLLRDVGVGPALSSAVDEGLAMADDASRAYRVEWPPRKPATAPDAYAAVRFGNGAAAAGLGVLRDRAAALTTPARGAPGGAVGQRTDAAYCAAGLLRAGGASERQRAIALADQVVRHIDGGRLYSTVDSVAAIALMAELSAARIIGGAGAVEIDGARLSTADAAAREGDARVLRAVEGVAAVEVTRVVEEDWSSFDAGLSVLVALERDGAPARRLRALDAIDLRVKIESGYKGGDILWVCLPDALSRVEGGGQVKRFAVDFRGRDEVSIPLAATGVTVGRAGEPAPARFAVCVRNMFEEERGGNPGWLDVTVTPPEGGGGSVLGRALAALKGLVGG